MNNINILMPSNWADYDLLDSGYGKRLERFGKYILVRPDPQAIWKQRLDKSLWEKADALFEKSVRTSAIGSGAADRSGQAGENNGNWVLKNKLPERWIMKYGNLSFWARLTPFKHTGVFPEQSVQWDFVSEILQKANRPTNVLNLFGYTGIISLAAASNGAKVTHLDASKQAISWAKQNQEVSGLRDKPIRWILDDAIKFVMREVKREVRYDGIIMDPPVFGHGPEGEIWKFNESFPLLLKTCRRLLSEKPLFVLINAYAVSASSLMLENMLKDFSEGIGGKIEVGELALKEKDNGRLLSTGIYGRWSNE